MNDLFAAAPARFVVGQKLIAKADFSGDILTRPVTVTAVDDDGITVQAEDGTTGRFNLQGEYCCPIKNQINTWLEIA